MRQIGPAAFQQVSGTVMGSSLQTKGKDMIITRLDSNSGDIEAYAVLPDIRWVWKSGVEETGNSPFGKTSPCSPRASTFALRDRKIVV